jgi:acid stress-induced BolA-like protein IbaG/YrbA
MLSNRLMMVRRLFTQQPITALHPAMRMFGDCGGNINGPNLIRNMEIKLRSQYDDCVLCKVHDTNGDASHVVIEITSSQFKGKLPLARHREINELLKEEIK